MMGCLDLTDALWEAQALFCPLDLHIIQQLSYLKQLCREHFQCLSPHRTDPPPPSSPLPSLIYHPHAHAHAKNAISFSVPAVHEMMPLPAPAHCGGKKMFSNILHLPSLISVLCRMPLTAWKLIYNAVFSRVGWKMGETQCRLGVWEWVQVLGVMWWQQWKSILCRANLIGAIFIPCFLDFREERFRAVIGLGITMATRE